MNNIAKIVDWLNEMGFDGEIPENLNYICTNSTSVIWNQLIENTKPRQKINELRQNVIINRLKKKPLNQQDEFSFPIKEISLFIKRQKLQEKLKNLELSIAEKQNKADNLFRENKLTHIFIEKVRAKIKANEEREYILNRKCQMLESKIQDTKDMLSIVGNLTPIEFEENCNAKEITDVLEECVKKLEQTVKSVPLPEVQTVRSSSQILSSARKPHKQTSFMEKYLLKSERKTARKSSAVKLMKNHAANKENRPNKCTKQLFHNENIADFKTPKRESLGLLPDTYFEENSISDTLPELDFKNSVFPQTMIFNESSLNKQSSKHFLEKIRKDRTVCEKLSQLLHNHSRQIIWNLFQNLDHNLHMTIMKNMVFDQMKNDCVKNINQDDISKLQAIHVQTEFKTMKNIALIKQLSHQVKSKKEEIKIILSKYGLAESKIDNIMLVLDFHLEDVGLNASLTAIKKEINSAKVIDEGEDLNMFYRKLAQVKDNITIKMKSINRLWSLSQEVLTSICNTRQETVACVRKLGPFVNDTTWCTALTQKICSQEMKTFQDFPLEYNRRFTYTDSSTYYRDICTEVFPLEKELSTDTLHMLVEVMENPLSPPETILLNLLRAKMKMNVLRNMKEYKEPDVTQKYSLEDFKKQECYLEYAIEKLGSINNSQSANKSLNISNVYKKILDIWNEMPFKNFISEDRKIDGKNYRYFENQYNEFYNNL